VTKIRAGKSAVRNLAVARAFVLHYVQTGCEAHVVSYSMGTGILFWE
jgi:hypothetical protein